MSRRRLSSQLFRSKRPSRIVASSSLADALPSGWRCCGVGLQGAIAALGGAGTSIGEIGIKRVDVAHPVSATTHDAASSSLSIFPHGVRGSKDDRLARGEAVGEGGGSGCDLLGKAALLIGARAVRAIERCGPRLPLVAERLARIVALSTEQQRQSDRRDDRDCRPEAAQ